MTQFASLSKYAYVESTKSAELIGDLWTYTQITFTKITLSVKEEN